jgi:hypothetical protein
MEFADYFKWKYQLNIDGTVAAYRLGALLASNSLVCGLFLALAQHVWFGLRINVAATFS